MLNRFMALRRTGLTIALAVLVVDQLSKHWALAQLGALGQMVIPGFLGVRVAFNPGMSFSLFANATNELVLFGYTLPPAIWLPLKFGVIAVVAIIAFVWWLGSSQNRFFQWGLGLIIGGAAGNLVDRALHGAVVDWLDFYLFGSPMWVFNIADAAISVGVALVVLDSLLETRSKGKVRS